MSEDTFFPAEEIVEFKDIAWDDYLKFLEKLRPYNLRFTYHRGCLEIMSLFPEHELYKRLLGRLVETLAEGLDMKIYPLGSTLFHHPQAAYAVTPDDSFYFRHRPQINGNKEIDLRVNPPPDLVIEVDLANRSGYHLPVYTDLKIPEIWLFNGKTLTIYLPTEQAYLPSDRSRIFPQFPIRNIAALLRTAHQTDYHKLLYEMRCWVQDYL
ncbi:MAG: Uma2 family endonuclease [Microcystaceae cyanobacterium]